MTGNEYTTGADVFAGRIARTLNDGFTTLMISIGHRTGLFDVLAALPPATSRDIADAAGLSERYVREWLAALTSSRIIEFDPTTATYLLPVEYAAVLTRSAGANNLASSAELVSVLGGVEDFVVAAFRGGGGLTRPAYSRLLDVQSESQRRIIDRSYVDAVVDLVPGLRQRLHDGAAVLDAGCGQGILLNAMAWMFPRSLFRGCDLSEEAIERAREQAGDERLPNVRYDVADMASLDESDRFDLVLAFESVHEQPFPRHVLRNIAVSLRANGVFLMKEPAASTQLARNVDHPFAPMLYALSTMHAVPLALAQGGEALGLMWGEEKARRMLVEAGFVKLRVEKLPVDPLRYYCVASR
jgi:2-polyprenyl-3-methyl-5-hydroxy-6-metoxy-1,4-benzoquinol methylase